MMKNILSVVSLVLAVMIVPAMAMGDQQQQHRPPPCGGQRPSVRVCEHDSFGGWCDVVCQGQGGFSFIGSGHNDKVSSIEVFDGTWEFYQHINFGGPPLRLGPGSYPSVENTAVAQGLSHGWNDTISSFSRAP